MNKKIAKIIFVLGLGFILLNINISLGSNNTDNSISLSQSSISLNFAKAASKKGESSFTTKMLTLQHPSSGWLSRLNALFQGFVYLLLAIGLIYVALRNILHLDIENYAIKKILPKVFIAAAFAPLSLRIFALLSTLIDKLQNVSIFEARPMDLSVMLGGGTAIASTTGLVSGIILASLGGAALAVGTAISLTGVGLIITLPVFCCAAIIALTPAVLSLGINLLMAVRPWVVTIGAAVAPLAIAMLMLPQTEGLFKRWMKIVAFWLFYPLILYAVIYVASIIPNLSGSTGAGGFSRTIGWILPYAIRFAMFLWAFRLPFAWEKDIGGIIQKFPGQAYGGGKKILGAGLGAAAIGGGLAYKLQSAKGKKLSTLAHDTTVAGLEGDRTANRDLAWKEFVSHKANERGITDAEYLDVISSSPEEALTAGDEFEADYVGEGKFKHMAIEKAGEAASKTAIDDFRKTDYWNMLENVQQYNPGGMFQAYAERIESGKKDVAKAHYRKSKINEWILGGEANMKHQEEIQKEDLSNIYTLPELEANFSVNYSKLIGRVAKLRGISIEAAMLRVQKELEQLYIKQASKQDYYEAFRDVLTKSYSEIDPLTGNRNTFGPIGMGTFANVKAGFDKQRQLASQYSRSAGKAGQIEQKRQEAISDSNRRMLGNAGVASGDPGEANGVDYPIMSQGQKKMIELLTNIRSKLGEGTGQSALDVAKLEVANLDLNQVSTDDFAGLTAQGHGHLDDIREHLSAKMDEQQVDQFMNEFIDANGRVTPSIAPTVSGDAGLKEMTTNYEINRAVRLEMLANVQGAPVVEKISNIILKQNPSKEDLQNLAQAATAFVRPNVTPQERENAQQLIGTKLGLGPEVVSEDTARHVARSLEVLTVKDRGDYA